MLTNPTPGTFICCDASIVVRLVTDPNARKVHAAWSAWIQQGLIIVAPALLRFEITNVFHRIANSTGATENDANNFLEVALQLPIQIRDVPRMHHQAITISRKFQLSATYEAHYLALSESLNCNFYTSDVRLFNKVSSDLGWVKLVG